MNIWQRRYDLRSLAGLPATLILSAIMLLPGGCATSQGAREMSSVSLDFALIGDMPYDAPQTANFFPNLIAELNAAPLAFVVHDGDIKSGASPCTDEIFEECRQQFATFEHPLIYVFGDNEWTDCMSASTGKTSAGLWAMSSSSA